MSNKFKNLLELKLEYTKPPLSLDKYRKEVKDVYLYNFNDVRNPLISFVIVAYNEDELLFRLLKTIVSTISKSYEIVVVDNGLPVNVKENLKSYSLKHIILNKNLGCSTGRNIGSLYCNADVVFFVDADGYLENVDIAFKKAEYLLNNKKLVAIRGKVVDTNTNWWRSKPKHYDLGNKQIPSFLDAEGVTLFKRADFIHAGGFEEGLSGNEGHVLCFRMVVFYNYDIDSFIYDPELILYHKYSSGLKHFLSKKQRYRYLSKIVRLRYPLIGYLTRYFMQQRRNINANYSKKSIFKKIFDYYINTNVDKIFIRNQCEYNKIKLNNSPDEITFSVIITIHNHGKYLKRAIESINSQTLQGIQLIIVDEFSNDKKTKQILDEISKSIYLIRLAKNSEKSAAPLAGIKKAYSEYIIILNGCDYLEPTYLEKAKNIFENYKQVGIVSCYQPDIADDILNCKYKNQTEMDIVLVRDYINSASCFRRAAMNEVVRYLEGLNGHDNKSHWIKIIKNGWRLKIIPQYLIMHNDYNE